VKLVFADTLYWGATLHLHDQYRDEVIRARKALGEVSLVTTDEILAELLDGLAQRGAILRAVAAQAVRKISCRTFPPILKPCSYRSTFSYKAAYSSAE